MLRLLEPHKPEVERYVPYPEHAMGNGRPRSVHLNAERSAQKRAAQDANLTRAAAGRRPMSAAASASGPHSLPKSGTQRKHTTAADRLGLALAAAGDVRRLSKGRCSVRRSGCGGTDISGNSTSERVNQMDNAVEQADTSKVPGLELSGLTAEDLDEAGILYDEERELLGPAVAPLQQDKRATRAVSMRVKGDSNAAQNALDAADVADAGDDQAQGQAMPGATGSAGKLSRPASATNQSDTPKVWCTPLHSLPQCDCDSGAHCKLLDWCKGNVDMHSVQERRALHACLQQTKAHADVG